MQPPSLPQPQGDMKLHAHALMEMGHDLKFSLKGADIFTCFRGAFKSRYGPHGYEACV